MLRKAEGERGGTTRKGTCSEKSLEERERFWCVCVCVCVCLCVCVTESTDREYCSVVQSGVE